MTQWAKNLPAMQETWVRPLGLKDPLEEGVAIHFSILAWKIPWTKKPGGLHPTHRVANSRTWLKRLSMHAQVYTYVKIYWAVGLWLVYFTRCNYLSMRRLISLKLKKMWFTSSIALEPCNNPEGRQGRAGDHRASCGNPNSRRIKWYTQSYRGR